VVGASLGMKGYMIKSTGFKIHDYDFEFPKKSYMQIEPFQGNNAMYTESEERFNASKAKFESLWKNLTLNDTHKFTWVNHSNLEVNSSVAKFPKVTCEIVNSTILQALN